MASGPHDGCADDPRGPSVAAAGGQEGARVSLRLLPRSGAPAAARSLVSDACTAWRMPHLVGAACLVVSELVANAVEHAGTDLVVLVSRSDGGLRIEVRDENDRMPDKPDHDSALHRRGRGLLLIDATAADWGVTPTRTGKVVWATLR